MKIKFKTVLLVHRNEQKIQNLSAELIRKGFFIITERTGTAALKILRRANIDLVISSGVFQDMQPKKFLTEIQFLGYIDKTIYISGEESIEDFFQFGSLGLHRYAPSNISPSNLLASVQEFFEDLEGFFLHPKNKKSSHHSSVAFLEQNRKKLNLTNMAAPEKRSQLCL